VLPNGTSWERWGDLCRNYDLEEKVCFVEGGIDKIQTQLKGPIEEGPIQEKRARDGKPKRETNFQRKWREECCSHFTQCYETLVIYLYNLIGSLTADELLTGDS